MVSVTLLVAAPDVQAVDAVPARVTPAQRCPCCMRVGSCWIPGSWIKPCRTTRFVCPESSFKLLFSKSLINALRVSGAHVSIRP
jgi:hypothetical protein